MKLRIILIFLLFPLLLRTQKFMVFDIDSSKSPVFSADFLLFDSENKLVEEITPSDFSVKLGSEELKIVKLKAPKRS